VFSLITTKMPACSHCVSCHRGYGKNTTFSCKQ